MVRKISIRDIIMENLSYKVVALFIALVLWITILGRRDFVLTKNIEVEFQVGAGRTVVSQSIEQVRVKVSGPRNSLRRFIDSGVSQLLTIDLSRLNDGAHEVEVPIDKIDVPFGVKVQSVRPATIRVQLKTDERKAEDRR